MGREREWERQPQYRLMLYYYRHFIGHSSQFWLHVHLIWSYLCECLCMWHANQPVFVFFRDNSGHCNDSSDCLANVSSWVWICVRDFFLLFKYGCCYLFHSFTSGDCIIYLSFCLSSSKVEQCGRCTHSTQTLMCGQHCQKYKINNGIANPITFYDTLLCSENGSNFEVLLSFLRRICECVCVS